MVSKKAFPLPERSIFWVLPFLCKLFLVIVGDIRTSKNVNLDSLSTIQKCCITVWGIRGIGDGSFQDMFFPKQRPRNKGMHIKSNLSQMTLKKSLAKKRP